jgi:predicted O-methyltransferase YrrM
MPMPSFARKLLWYLKQPALYPELARLGFNKIRRGLSKKDNLTSSRARAESWCNACAISTDEALEKTTRLRPSGSLKSQFPDIFKRSEEAAAACPVKMGGAGDLDLLYRLAEFAQARAVIETGVAYGWSSLALLLSLKNRNGLLVSTDLPYAGLDNDPYVGCVVPDELRENWKLLRGPDRQRVPEAIELAGTLDLCHYDSDKSYSGRMWTYPRLWEALCTGGLFISDDIGDNMGFADFARSVAIEPIVVRSGEKYVGILIKP